MIETVITALIYICLVVLVVYLVVLWVLEEAGLPLPPKVVRIFWVIVVLVEILILVRLLLPGLAHHALALVAP